MNTRAWRGKTILLLTLLMLVSMSACGPKSTPTVPSTTSIHTPLSNIPLGSGNNPEPGTDGKPRPTPNGHSESILVANDLAFIGSDNGALYALGARDGTVHWQHKIGSAVFVFAAANGVVYVTADRVVYALNASNGSVLWQYRADKYISQVLVADGMVYANTAAEGNSSTLYALGATDGSLHWRYSLASWTPGLLGIIDGAVYDLQTSGSPGGPGFAQALYALQAGDGQVLWHAPLSSTDGWATSAVVEFNNIIYIATTHGAIYALHADTGVQLWHAAQPAEGNVAPGFVAPVVVNGLVYTGDTQGITAYRASDGMRIWQYKQNVSGPFIAQPVVVDGVVYVGGSAGLIVALRATDGTRLWQHRGAGVFIRPLTVADGLVIYDNGPVYALRTSDGTQLWQSSAEASGEYSDAEPPEVVGGGVVFVGSDTGSVQAIQASDGKLLWRYTIQEQAVTMPPVYSAYVTFAASLSYQQALEILTGLGLKTFADCHFSWMPGDDKGIFSADHLLTVVATVNSAPLWLDRLSATPGVQSAQAGGPHSCPIMRPGNGPRYLPSGQAGTFVQVTFADATQYAAALDATNALGFRLADPCYEQARAQGKKPTWNPLGQGSSFDKTHTLLLATTAFNATSWASQLAAVAGVIKTEAPFTMPC